jgi:hypothetical protein
LLTNVQRFSELALLLPRTDITLIFFGRSAFNLVHEARAKHPDSLAAKDIVWSYTAPEVAGGGSVDIKLYSKSIHWDMDVTQDSIPDVLVGLNAGLMTYSEWKSPLVYALM